MMPKYYTIDIHVSGKLNLDDDEIEFYQREGFKEDAIKNRIEADIRDNIWRYIHDNNIKITIE